MTDPILTRLLIVCLVLLGIQIFYYTWLSLKRHLFAEDFEKRLDTQIVGRTTEPYRKKGPPKDIVNLLLPSNKKKRRTRLAEVRQTRGIDDQFHNKKETQPNINDDHC